jgi:hypothetical protein
VKKYRGKDWCILRTTPGHTLGLAASLTMDGYEAWTPAQTISARKPRANVRRLVTVPIIPRFVFARAAHLVELLELAKMPVKPRRGAGLMEPAHAAFNVMRCFGGIPLVDDRALDELRRTEAKRAPRKRAAYSFPRDAVTRVKEGMFGGLTGAVLRSTPTATMLDFGRFTVELPTSILEIDEAYCAPRANRKVA